MTGSTASSWPVPGRSSFDAPAAPIRAAYEHPWLVRVTHWLTAISLFVLVGSGLQIFHAFPSFGPKIPQENFFDPPQAIRIGGWLGGALMWHFTFMWIFMGAGAAYLVFQIDHAGGTGWCCSRPKTCPASGPW